MNKVYFPNLNGLRFVAALLVIVHHIEQFKHLFGLDNYWDNSFIKVIGKLGVVLFFVLSGFLITYLLLEEEKETKTIKIKHFYIRRILRIWPLYFLIVLLGFFVLSNIQFFYLHGLTKEIFINFTPKFLMFVFFLPNIALALYPAVPFASQTWSVGIEEQFYVVWPIAVKFIKKRLTFFYVVIFGYIFMNVFGFKFIKTYLYYDKSLDLIATIWASFSIDCMAIGGLFAIYLHKKSTLLYYFYNKYVQCLVLLVLFSFIALGIKIPFIHYEFYGFLFGVLILNLASNPNSVILLENTYLNYLGKISYGLYMFHPIAIVVALKLLAACNIKLILLQYMLSILFSVLLAAISYAYFEKVFISKKTKYSKIVSGDNVDLTLKS
jgi:peptidoglycan/LPS O-acetylase OafA/YrhL